MKLVVWCHLGAAAVTLSSVSLPGQGPPEYNVPEESDCRRCTLTAATRFFFTASVADGEINQLPFGVRLSPDGTFWVLAEGSVPRVYSATGGYIKPFGRFGKGPGEFTFVEDLFWVAGDSIVVVDGGNRRATVFAPTGAYARQLRTSAQLVYATVLKWPVQVLVSGSMPTPAAAGLQLHLASFSGDEVRPYHSFGPERGLLVPGRRGSTYHLLARGSRGVIASVRREQHNVYLWSAEGKSVAILRRRAPWFPDTSSGRIGTPSTPPSPAVSAIHVDRDGLIWLFSRVAAATWSRAWSRVPPGAREVARGQVDYPLLFNTRVEVIDPSTRRLVATSELSGVAVSTLGDGLVAMYGRGPNGDALRVEELRLTR